MWLGAWRAYPRARGATMTAFGVERGVQGLSPRTRGNLLAGSLAGARLGPIPAHAGQPARSRARNIWRRAYPRARGATGIMWSFEMQFAGLSPRTRGNRFGNIIASMPHGPIPAHAGQPAARTSGACARRAYPRARGATAPRNQPGLRPRGLSPRTRGNLDRAVRAHDLCGPIPAHAGQPARPGTGHQRSRAYPRARGATPRREETRAAMTGLSPRTRGNPTGGPFRMRARGPIPAHAGQPQTKGKSQDRQRAYPRARGATGPLGVVAMLAEGLSPRTRGNQDRGPLQTSARGPIPAHAGQP